MIIFVITGQAPPILILTLLVMCYLTGYELWKEGEDAAVPDQGVVGPVRAALQRPRLRDLLDLAREKALPPRQERR